jgi:hypothetical protein
MTIKTSTGLRNGMLGTGSFKSLMDGGLLKVYGGAVPASADAALGGATLLVTISLNGAGGGLSFDAAAADGVIVKTASELWTGTVGTSGTATFYRFVAAGDDGTASTTQKRVQGTVGTAGADGNITSTALVAAAPQNADYFSIALPTA